MQQRSVTKSSAAPAAKTPAPLAAAAASKKKAPTPLSSKSAAPASKSSSAIKGKVAKVAVHVAGDCAKGSAAPVAAPAAAAAAAAPPVPSDREGQARVIYNHYNKFFPMDASGKMRWQVIDDEYCLSFGASHPAQHELRFGLTLTPS